MIIYITKLNLKQEILIDTGDHEIMQLVAGENCFSQGYRGAGFSFISNPDGTIRWIYPNNLEVPTFLNFYSTSTWRAKILYYIIKVAFLLRLPKLVRSGNLKLEIQEDSVLGNILIKYKNDGFSIFTGTVGENRKAIVEINKNNQTIAFVKIPLTESSKILILNEIKQLNLIRRYDFKKIIVPELLGNVESNVIELSNIKPLKCNQNYKLTDLHVEVLQELYSHTNVAINWNELSQLEQANDTLCSLSSSKEFNLEIGGVVVKRLLHNIRVLSNNLLHEGGSVVTGISHGDFTPWNMYIAKDQIHLLDWELSENETPLLFDLIHFTFQSTILIEKKGYKDVVNILKALLRKDSVQSLILQYNIDFNKTYTFYLIKIITYYIQKYSEQNNLHIQVTWLLKVWDEAVSDLPKNNNKLF